MQDLLIVLFIFPLGAIVGSFVNVLIDRIPVNISPLRGRSFCMSCKRQIKAYENIPIISYIALRGKCAGCKEIIPKRLILVEAICALGFVLITYVGISQQYSIYQLITLLISFSIFVWIFFTDIDYGIIPDYANISLFSLSILNLLILMPSKFPNHILSALCSLGFFALLFFGTKGKGMGFGDVKLSFVLGLLLGFPSIVVGLYGAFLTGAIVSIILVIWKRKNFRKSTVPFGPFLVFSSMIALLYGEWIFENLIRAFL